MLPFIIDACKKQGFPDEKICISVGSSIQQAILYIENIFIPVYVVNEGLKNKLLLDRLVFFK